MQDEAGLSWSDLYDGKRLPKGRSIRIVPISVHAETLDQLSLGKIHDDQRGRHGTAGFYSSMGPAPVKLGAFGVALQRIETGNISSVCVGP